MESGICSTFLGCCGHAIVSDLMVALSNADSRCGYSAAAMTLTQFIFICISSVYTRDGNIMRMIIPLKYYAAFVATLFTISMLNSAALGYRISVPVHQLIRSGGLPATMLANKIFLSKRYSGSQVVSVLIVFAGSAVTLIADGYKEKQSLESGSMEIWLMGVMMLTTVLVLTSLLGVLQEYVFQRYSNWEETEQKIEHIRLKMKGEEDRQLIMKMEKERDSRRAAVSAEGLLYTHVFALPLFLVFFSDIHRITSEWGSCPAPRIAYLSRPTFYLIIAAILHVLCISGVYKVHSIAGSLTTTLISTIRKHVTILISVLLFNMLGSVLITVGTFMYTKANSISKPKKD